MDPRDEIHRHAEDIEDTKIMEASNRTVLYRTISQYAAEHFEDTKCTLVDANEKKKQVAKDDRMIGSLSLRWKQSRAQAESCSSGAGRPE